ncbi:MAG: VWA domain-containing protein [Thermoanaerobaculia bacterium]
MAAFAAQGADLPPRGWPGLRATVEVTALDLDVVATKDGKPVTDLSREEFLVKVDGKVFPLDYFTRIEEGTLFGPDLSKASPDLVLESVQGDAGTRYLSRQILLYVDDEHLMPFDRPRAFEGLRDLVYRLSPSDQVALFRYNRGVTRALVPFTASKEALLDGIAKLETMPPGGLSWYVQAEQDYRQARAANGSQSRMSIIRDYSAQAKVREDNALSDLRRAVGALAARSGKRTLVYVGTGIELHPGQTLGTSVGIRGLQQFEYDVTPNYRAVLTEANEVGVTIYAIDARGLTTDVDPSESHPSDMTAFERTSNRREVPAGLAAETGGILFENRNVFKGAAEQIYRESSTFYSLGVTLANLPKKDSYSIRVSVSRPGVTVRSRSAFVPMSAEKAERNRVELALMTPDAHGDFGVEVLVGAPTSKGLGRRQSPLEAKIPLLALTFHDAAGRKEAAVDVAIAAVEDSGARSDVTIQHQTISLDPAAWAADQGRYYLYTATVKTRKGNHRFVVTVKDVATNRMGLGSASVRIE